MSEALEVPLYMRRYGLDPGKELDEILETEGVVQVALPDGTPAYLVCRYEDARQVLSDPQRFTSVLPRSIGAHLDDEERRRLQAGTMLLFDPPEHTRLRRTMTPQFTARRLERLEPTIAAIVESALDDLEGAGKPADLVRHFALPVPLLVICELVGVEGDDHAEMTDRFTRLMDLSLTPQQHTAVHAENRRFLAELVIRARAAPGENLLGMLVREHGAQLSTEEVVGIVASLLIGGHETTSGMLSLGTLALLQHPDQLAMVRDDPTKAQQAVEELLRFLSVVSVTGRTTTTDVHLAGRTIPAGSSVLISLPRANRDRAFLRDADRLDIDRAAPGHVAFGHGVHRCLGAPLARLQMRIAFPALLRRFPGLALAQPDAEPAFRPFGAVYGVETLPVTW
ncbi:MULTISPECIES: cytochrome P450 [Micromonospora]|uniref:cytochrome P450 n=1 Tax=Micromonospora TaxID=1873 RepID=UPI001E4C1DC8|nr:cytochrome P450 [Micromonospora sp. NBRC 110038]